FALLPDVSTQDALGVGTAGPWEGKPDPAEKPPEPLPDKAFLHLRNKEAPLLASLGGPFVLEHKGDRSREPDRAIVGDKDERSANYPLSLLDLRTGKVAGKFAWKTPVWNPVRLSPDGRYVVGPDNKEGLPATRKDGWL